MSKEIVRYGIFNEYWGCVDTFGSLQEAEEDIKKRPSTYGKNYSIVKLTGQLPEPKKIKKIALYAYRYGNGPVIVSSELVTEDQARKFCNGLTLVKWPYGGIIEIEVEGSTE